MGIEDTASIDRDAAAASVTPPVTDPVCGMTVDPGRTAHHAEHAGQAFHFCSAGCRTKFVADPQRFLQPAPGRAGARRRDLHLPDASADPPGRAPGPARSAAWRWSRRSSPPTAVPIRNSPTCAAGSGSAWRSRRRSSCWRWAATSPDCRCRSATACRAGSSSRWRLRWCSGRACPFFQRGWASIVGRSLNMFTLIAMGVGVAWTYSVAAVLAPGAFPPAFRDVDGRRPGLLRGGGRDHRAGAAGPGAGAERPRAHLRRDQGAARPGAEDGAAHPRRRRRRGSDARPDPGRRPPAGAAGREGPGGRRADRRPGLDRRVAGHRRIHAGDQGSRGQGDRRIDQQDRLVRHARRKGRRRHPAVPDRADGRRRAAQPCADPAHGRPGLGLVRAGGDRGRRAGGRGAGPSLVRSRVSPTRWSRRSRC